MLNILLLFNLYTVYMLMEDSKDLLVLSIDDVTYRME